MVKEPEFTLEKSCSPLEPFKKMLTVLLMPYVEVKPKFPVDKKLLFPKNGDSLNGLNPISKDYKKKVNSLMMEVTSNSFTTEDL
mmetsp:Transcript_37320/g.56902  ORF Transcript_37320/g.56902 Transcript_37320/m.56902 type:complete len:84 (+) Transcript_37320:366-617(+)